jgi:hypothetical protein
MTPDTAFRFNSKDTFALRIPLELDGDDLDLLKLDNLS